MTTASVAGGLSQQIVLPLKGDLFNLLAIYFEQDLLEHRLAIQESTLGSPPLP